MVTTICFFATWLRFLAALGDGYVMKRKLPATLIVVLFICLLMVGCQQDSAPEQSAAQPASGVKLPTFSNVTLEALKTSLGPDFAVEKAGPPTVLLREAGAHRVAVIVMHDAAGKIQSLSVHVIGDQGTDDQIDQLYAESLAAIAKALGVPTEDDFEGYVKIGVVKTRLGFPFNFIRDSVYFDLIPNDPLVKSWQWVPFKPNQVKRDVYVSPRQGIAGKGLGPIQGASVKQLTKLLDGFTVKAKIEGEQLLFVRQMDDHQQVVHCMIEGEDRLTRLEAFVADVAEGAKAIDLNFKLWLLVANLEYKECNPAEVKAFLQGPLPNYSVPVFKKVGYAEFCLPVASDGGRKQMGVWAFTPPKKKAAKKGAAKKK